MVEKELFELFNKIAERNDWPEHYEKPEILKLRIEYYAKKLMDKYDSAGQLWDFLLFLKNWLKNTDSIDEKILLINSLSYFTFFNTDQCKSLYTEALYGPIFKWLIEIKNYDILDKELNDKINESIQHTYISAATDSADITAMSHTNDLRLDNMITWRSYIKNIKTEPEETKEKIKKIKIELCKNDLSNYGYKQIVVLEDYVGTGDQIKDVIDFFGSFTEWKILFVPLVICPQGDNAIIKILNDNKYNHISYEPLSILPWELILSDDRPSNSNELKQILVDLKEYAKNNYNKVMGTEIDSPQYLGYKNTGSLFAQYTNCPDTTLPLFHHKENLNWHPLFPRSER